jgi:hypothetical protein
MTGVNASTVLLPTVQIAIQIHQWTPSENRINFLVTKTELWPKVENA